MKRSARHLLWIETVVSVASLIAAAVTIAVPDWIETVFGVDPDKHSGSAEWLVVLALTAVGVTAAVLATRSRMRLRGQPVEG